MRTNARKQTFQIGTLITALYDEVAKITSNKNLQAELVYVMLQDLRRMNLQRARS